MGNVEKILVLSTASRIRICNILDALKGKNVYMLIPESQIDLWTELYPWVEYVTTKYDFMDYNQLKCENKLAHYYFDKIIIPSGSNNFYTFGDVFSFVMELNSKEVIWVDSVEKRMIMKNNHWDNNVIGKNRMIAKVFFEFGYWFEKGVSFILGRKY